MEFIVVDEENKSDVGASKYKTWYEHTRLILKAAALKSVKAKKEKELLEKQLFHAKAEWEALKRQWQEDKFH